MTMTKTQTFNRLLFAALACLTFAALLAFAPAPAAQAAEGDTLGYVYAKDDYQSILVQAEQDEQGLTAEGWTQLGVLTDGETIPWDEYRSTITSVSFVKAGGNSVCPTTMAGWFQDCTALTSATFEGLDTSAVTDMSSLFNGCSKLANLDISGFDTSQVADFDRMFQGCQSIAELDLSHFDVSSAESMQAMFQEAVFTSLDIRPIEVAFGFPDVRGMLDCCSLERIDVSPFFDFTDTEFLIDDEDYAWAPESDTSQVLTDLDALFNYLLEQDDPVAFVHVEAPEPTDVLAEGTCGDCTWSIGREDGQLVIAPTEGDSGSLAKWTRTAPWSEYAANIKSVVFNGNVQATGTFPGFFKGCSALESADLSGLDTSAATNLSGFFSGCSALQEVDLSFIAPQNTKTTINLSNLLFGCTSLQTVDLSQVDISGARTVNLNSMLSSCTGLQAVDLSGAASLAEKASDLSNLFMNCTALQEADLSEWNTARAPGMIGLFRGCTALTSVKLPNVEGAGTSSLKDLFNGCTSLAEIDWGCLDTANADSMAGMFQDCTSLESVDLSQFDTTSLTSTTSMFQGCTKLSSVTLPDFSEAFLEEMEDMFADCQSLESLDLSTVNTQDGMTIVSRLCAGCENLTTVTLGEGFSFPAGDDVFPAGLWKTEGNEETRYYVLANAPDEIQGVAATYQRITSETENVPFAELDEDGTLTFKLDDTVSAGDHVWPIFDFDTYKSADQVPWHAERANIKQVVVEGSGQPTSCAYWFADCTNLESVDLTGFDTSKAKSFADMFSGCTSLSDFAFDGATGKATDFSGMFHN